VKLTAASVRRGKLGGGDNARTKTGCVAATPGNRDQNKPCKTLAGGGGNERETTTSDYLAFDHQSAAAGKAAALFAPEIRRLCRVGHLRPNSAAVQRRLMLELLM